MSRIVFKTPLEFASEEARKLTRDQLLEQPIFRGKRTFSGTKPPELGGDEIIRTVVRTSTISQADADQKAYFAVKALVEGIVSGAITEEASRYEYETGEITEPIYEELFYTADDVEQTLIGRVSVNAYGALIINSPQVMFVDVDTGTDPDQKQTSPIVTEARALELLQEFVDANNGYGFRVYRTFAGLRYLCITHLADPTSEWTANLMTALAADRSYRALCRIQKCFRARLTPKPWRMADVESSPSRKVKARIEKLGEYLAAAAGNATCEFVGVYGTDSTLPIAEKVRVHHDNQPKALSGLPLA